MLLLSNKKLKIKNFNEKNIIKKNNMENIIQYNKLNIYFKITCKKLIYD